MTLLRLKGKGAPEYSDACRLLSVKMMQPAVGSATDVVIGAIVVMVAAVLIKYGSGADDVDTFSESVKQAIKDHPRTKGST